MITKERLALAIVCAVFGGALIGFLTHWSMTLDDKSSTKADCVYSIVHNPDYEGVLPECAELSDADKKEIFGDLTYFSTVIFE